MYEWKDIIKIIIVFVIKIVTIVHLKSGQKV